MLLVVIGFFGACIVFLIAMRFTASFPAAPKPYSPPPAPIAFEEQYPEIDLKITRLIDKWGDLPLRDLIVLADVSGNAPSNLLYNHSVGYTIFRNRFPHISDVEFNEAHREAFEFNQKLYLSYKEEDGRNNSADFPRFAHISFIHLDGSIAQRFYR